MHFLRNIFRLEISNFHIAVSIVAVLVEYSRVIVAVCCVPGDIPCVHYVNEVFSVHECHATIKFRSLSSSREIETLFNVR